jgi:hypothetical protein
MSMETWKSIATGLGLGTLLLSACDLSNGEPGGPDVAEPGTAEDGATETEGDPPAETEGDTEPGGSAEGQTSADDGEPPPEPESCSQRGESRACTTEEGEAGTQFCDGGWGPCLTQPTCTPGESQCCEGWGTGEDDGGGSTSEGGGEGDESEGGSSCEVSEHCELYAGVPDWDSNHSFDAGCNTPLVLSFDGRPAELVPARAATFDLDGNGGCITTDWPEASTPWLALDVDGSGTIDSGRELFGSGTRLQSGKRAAHGFAALAELDDDGDGRIDASDPAFARLVLWGDHDGDRRSSFAEAQPLSHHRILSIELGFHVDRQCDARANCGVERAAFHFVDEHGAVRQGEVVDLHLACQ